MDPKSPFVKARAQEEGLKPKVVSDAILGLIAWVDKINNASNNGKIKIKLYNAMMLDYYWRIDDSLYIGPYWYGKDSNQTITIKMVSGSRGFVLCTDYFDELWNNPSLSYEP